jgi:hypothetical protein
MTLRTLFAVAVETMSGGCTTEGVIVVNPAYPASQHVNMPPGSSWCNAGSRVTKMPNAAVESDAFHRADNVEQGGHA